MAPAPGERVVVRHLLPDGRATDVIGRLLDDGDPVVLDREGEPYPVPRSTIVAFKTVPPQPVRASLVRSLGLARARGWNSVQREWIDGWYCRAAPGITGNRANCAAPLHPIATLAGLAGPRAWFAERGVPLRLTLTERLLRGGPDETERRTRVQTAPTARIADSARTRQPTTEVLVSDTPDDAWLARTGTVRELAESANGAVRFASVTENGETVAAGRLAVTDDAAGNRWGGISSVAVARHWRRRGLASATMQALAHEARSAGAQNMYLEVEIGNDPALHLYESLGFAPLHDYGYWTEGR